MHNQTSPSPRTPELAGLRDIAGLMMSSRKTAVLVTDRQGKLTAVNPAFTLLTGYTVEEVIGRSPGEFLQGPLTNAETVRHMSAQLERGLGFEVEILNYHKDGRPIWLSLIVDPLYDEHGAVSGFVGVQVDVSRRQQNDHLHQAILRCAGDCIISTDPSGVIATMNPAAEQLLGYSEHEVAGRMLWTQLHCSVELAHRLESFRYEQSDLAPPWWAIFVHHSRPGCPDAEREWKFATSSGRLVPVRIVMSAIYDELGTLQGFVGIASDLSAAKQEAERWKAHEQRLTKIAENVPGMVYQFLMRPDGSTCFPYSSDRIHQVYGVSPEDVLEDASAVFAALHPEDLERVAAGIELSRSTLNPWEEEYRARGADGVMHWLHGEATPEPLPDGSVLWHGFISDITERKTKELELLRMADVVRQAAEGVLITSVTGTIEYVNPAFERMTGYSAAEAIGQRPSILKSGYQEEDTYDDLWRTIRAGKVWSGRFLNRRKDGSLYHEDATIFPVLDANKRPMNFVGLKRDVTREVELDAGRREAEMELARYTRELELARDAQERNAAILQELVEQLTDAKQKAEAASRAKADFLSTMSHEIRTPMNGMLGMTDLLASTELSPEQQNYVSTIRNSGQGLLSIINDVLDYSKMEAGKMVLETTEFHLEHLIEEILDLVGFTAQEKGLEIYLNYPLELPRWFFGDPTRLRQIVLNLLTNGIKFTERGRVVVHVAMDNQDGLEGAPQISLSVQDSGIGIAPDKLPLLFQDFTQMDSSTTRRFGGTGLGLAISKRLTEMMGGSIDVESTLGRGSRFRLLLPMKVSAQANDWDTRRGILTGIRIRIETLDRGLGDLLRRASSEWGMDVWTSEKQERPQLLILDQDLHEFEFPGASALRDLPRLILGSGGSAKWVDNSIQIKKPFRLERLFDSLCELAGRGNAAALKESRKRARLLEENHGELFRGRRVLLAEDNRVNQRVAAKMLEQLGMEVDIASDGLIALERALNGRYDAILMDCQMPEMDGFETSRRIRSAETQHVPIIALTANALPEDRNACLSAGMDDYITKPVRREDLRQVLVRWLEPVQS